MGRGLREGKVGLDSGMDEAAKTQPQGSQGRRPLTATQREGSGRQAPDSTPPHASKIRGLCGQPISLLALNSAQKVVKCVRACGQNR